MPALKFLVKVGEFVASYVCQVPMLVLVISDPIMRYFVGQPFTWSHQLSALLMVVMANLGFAAVFVRGEHLNVTQFTDLLPRKAQDLLSAIVSIFTSLFIGLLTYSFVMETYSSFVMGIYVPQGDFLVFPWQAAATFGMVVLFLTSIGYSASRLSILFSYRSETGAREEFEHLFGM